LHKAPARIKILFLFTLLAQKNIAEGHEEAIAGAA
jgi:hypothetical protein